MTKNERFSLCEVMIGLGIVIMIFGFMAGIVITAIGGNNWELMKESPKLMVVFQIDELVMWSGLFLTIGSAVAWNILDKKSN